MSLIRELRRGVFIFSSRRRHTRYWRDWSSDVCSSDLLFANFAGNGAGVPKKTSLSTLKTINTDYQLVDTEEKRKRIIQKLLTSKILSLDTETTGTEPMEAELVGMSFSIAENEAFYVRSEERRVGKE